MHRVRIEGLLDDSLVKRLENIINSDGFNGEAIINPHVVPEPTIIECTIIATPTPDGQVIAKATVNDETINTCVASTESRALAALGLNAPDAHSHQLYRKRFGTNYKLVAKHAASRNSS